MQPIRVTKISITVTYDVEGEADCTAAYMKRPIRPSRASVEIFPDGRPSVSVTGFQVKKDGQLSATQATHPFRSWDRLDWPEWVERLARHAAGVRRVAIAAAK